MSGDPSKKTIIISGVNLVEAGPLSVFKDCLANIEKWDKNDLEIIALVNTKELFKEFNSGRILFLEYPFAKKNWIFRVVFEYFGCMSISKKYNPDVWFSIHDITPNIKAAKRIVYCHNPSPFYKLSFREAKMERSLLAFNLLYKFLYRINIKKNDYVIVQQNWIRDYFIKHYNLKNVIVAYPNVNLVPAHAQNLKNNSEIFRFIYPAFPRVFKNFEVFFKAADYLRQRCQNFEVIVTFSGNENKYANYILNKFGHIPQIKFIGMQKRESVYKLYDECDCLVFPSKLETWGLPITEMKMYNKPIIVADCNYSHETVGQYNKACFFNPEDYLQLQAYMEKAMHNTLEYTDIKFSLPKEPFTQSWQQLFEYFF